MAKVCEKHLNTGESPTWATESLASTLLVAYDNAVSMGSYRSRRTENDKERRPEQRR